jgi:MYXO-CTERM domain-containing protein
MISALPQKYFARTTSQFLAAWALAGGLSLTAHAQIGSGWIPTTETPIIQTSAGCTVVPNSSGGGVFSVPGPGIFRAEYRFPDLSQTTTEQFQGDVTLNNLDGDRVTVKQTFGPEPSSSWSLIAVSKGLGGFYDVHASPQVLLAPFMVGQTARINTIYDPSGGPGKVSVAVYINGTFVEKFTDGTAPDYNKIGSYVSSTGTGPCVTTWQNVLFWTGGNTVGVLSAPTFSVAPDTYASAQVVTISSVSGGASIVYTTDGSTPTESGGLITHGTSYSGAVTISASTTLTAMAFESGFTDSTVTSGTYTINSATTPSLTATPTTPGTSGGGAFDDWFLGFLALAGLFRWRLRRTR